MCMPSASSAGCPPQRHGMRGRPPSAQTGVWVANEEWSGSTGAWGGPRGGREMELSAPPGFPRGRRRSWSPSSALAKAIVGTAFPTDPAGGSSPSGDLHGAMRPRADPIAHPSIATRTGRSASRNPGVVRVYRCVVRMPGGPETARSVPPHLPDEDRPSPCPPWGGHTCRSAALPADLATSLLRHRAIRPAVSRRA